MSSRPYQQHSTIINNYCFAFHSYQKGGKETILEEELEFKGIEEEDEEESLVDLERSGADGEKDKGEERLSVGVCFSHESLQFMRALRVK